MNFKLWNTKGVVLEQKKEPALSRDLQEISGVRPTVTTIEPLHEGEIPSMERLIRLCDEASIIDERDNKALSQVLGKWRGKKISCIVADAIDDEPYVSSQTNPMMKHSAEAAYGLRLLKAALKAENAYFAVFREMYYLNSRIPTKIEEFPVKKMGGKYPMEKRAVRRLGDDVLTVGVCALIHLARAAQEGIAQSTCFVTVAGNCIGSPCNLEVTLGTPLSRLLEHCGLIMDPSYLAIGSAMKGTAVVDPEKTLVQVTTSALIAIREPKKNLRHMDCIGCSRCVEVCPENLNPMELYRAASSNRRETAYRLGMDHCIGCSACSYICPSCLEISYMIQSKKEKWKKGQVKSHEA